LILPTLKIYWQSNLTLLKAPTSTRLSTPTCIPTSPAGRGIRLFDYGRSKIGTGAYDFKKNWGFTPEPLYYEYHLVKGQALPDLNPLNPKYRLLINTWQRLPLWLSQWIGPWVSRYLG